MKINEIIIVEGQHDINFLKTFLDADFIQTNGSSLPEKTREMIRKLSESGKEFLILTDPDYPGEKIRKELLEIIPNAKQAFVRKENARTSKKVGVEHSTKQEVLKAIEKSISYSEKKEIISKEEYYELGLSGKEDSAKKREQLGKVLFIGQANAKTFYTRLNMLTLTHDELMNIIKEVTHG